MKKSTCVLVLFLCLSMLSRKRTYAQDDTPFADVNVDDLGDVSDEFQELFFEALKQKGIENYERAITALDACIRMEESLPILYFERGKNYAFLKQNENAETDFLKALSLKANDEVILEALYEIYFRERDYDKAETTVKQLIYFDSQYKEDLARIYAATRRYGEALVLLDDLDAEKGKDRYRDRLRDSIYKISGNTRKQAQTIEKKIASNPKNETEYLKLIYIYSEQGDTEKAYEMALKLQEINPSSDEVQLALYKFDLEKGNTDSAIKAMNTVFKSKRINATAKHKVLNDFLLFVNENPEYEPQLEEAIVIFDTQVSDARIFRELGGYYVKRGLKNKALPYFRKALAQNSENLELIKNNVLLELDSGNFAEAEGIAASGLELYPSQPLLYLTYGVALKEQSKYGEAISQLETGVDYIIDDIKLESDFYQQLGETHTLHGDAVKGQRYLEKAKTLKAQVNK